MCVPYYNTVFRNELMRLKKKTKEERKKRVLERGKTSSNRNVK